LVGWLVVLRRRVEMNEQDDGGLLETQSPHHEHHHHHSSSHSHGEHDESDGSGDFFEDDHLLDHDNELRPFFESSLRSTQHALSSTVKHWLRWKLIDIVFVVLIASNTISYVAKVTIFHSQCFLHDPHKFEQEPVDCGGKALYIVIAQACLNFFLFCLMFIYKKNTKLQDFHLFHSMSLVENLTNTWMEVKNSLSVHNMTLYFCWVTLCIDLGGDVTGVIEQTNYKFISQTLLELFLYVFLVLYFKEHVNGETGSDKFAYLRLLMYVVYALVVFELNTWDETKNTLHEKGGIYISSIGENMLVIEIFHLALENILHSQQHDRVERSRASMGQVMDHDNQSGKVITGHGQHAPVTRRRSSIPPWVLFFSFVLLHIACFVVKISLYVHEMLDLCSTC
jgi:hypothetical protein